MNPSFSLGKAAALGAVYLGVSQALRVALTLGSTIIVARILTPSDYGVMAMVAPITAFLLLFQNLGLSQAAIQARELSNQQSSDLFWLNMIAATVVGLALIPAGSFVGWFYDDPRAGHVTAASSVIMLASGCAVQHLALLSRNLDFRRLSIVEIASAGTTFVGTIVAALLLRTYWALWWGLFLGAATTAILAWALGGWHPSWSMSLRRSGALIRFGGAITGYNVLNFLNRNLDNILIGRVWGPTPLGLYDRSYKLMMFPLQSLNGPAGRIMLPVLSRLQDDPIRFRHSYLMVLRAIMLLAGPPIAVAVATSDRLVPLLLGESWRAAAPIFFWLSLAAFLQPIGNSTGWIFMATGRASAMMRWGAFSSVLLVLGFVIGVQKGPVGVSAAYFITVAILMPFLFLYSARGTPLKARDFYAVLLPATTSAVLAWASIKTLLDDWNVLLTIGVGVPIAYAWALSVLWVTPDGRRTLRKFVTIAISAVQRWQRGLD